MRTVLSLAWLVACSPDLDGDGVRASADCDDADADVGEAGAWFRDLDGDGHGGSATTEAQCARPADAVRLSDDCDDAAPDVSPEADEQCNGRDDDCDGLVDEGGPGSAGGGARTLYADEDGDGYGDGAAPSAGCAVGDGLSVNAFDCDDADASVHPATVESCDLVDQDCDGLVDDGASDAAVWFADLDGDGAGDPSDALTACTAPAGFVDAAGDCDDDDDGVGPAADESCNGGDDDCDGAIDEDAVDGAQAWRDRDADGYGDPDAMSVGCEPPNGYVANSQDCDDKNASLNPATAWFLDEDDDGFGTGEPVSSCTRPAGRVADDRDCDDATLAIHPGATETCNAIDDDCDGVIDGEAATDAFVWFLDADGDGYGDPRARGKSCQAPDGFVKDASDCDDGDVDVGPGHAEVCDNADNDCDGKVDSDDPGLVGVPTWYVDADQDGHGAPTGGITTCTPPADRVSTGDDCDDADDDVRPGAIEVCNTVDDDCDGQIDSSDPTFAGDATFYEDADRDGWGDASVTRTGCNPLPGWSDDAGDCDDDAAAVHPGATEVCGNFVDDDCDGGPGPCVLPPVIALPTQTLPGWSGSGAYERFGVSLAAPGDLDGDGLADLLVGATDASRPAGPIGGAYVIAGDSGKWPIVNADPSLAFLRGEKSYDYAGRSVGVTGDLDGDGVNELLVGANGYDLGTKYEVGAAYVVSGASRGGVALSTAFARLYGENSTDNAGFAIAGLGDVDGDGKSDIAVGAPQADDAGSNAGATYVVLTPPAGSRSLSTSYAKILGASDSDYAGSDVAGGGDFDGDGRGDLVIGAYNAEGGGRGAAYVITSPAAGTWTLASSADLKLIGASQNAKTGEAVSFAGDVNGDGLDDVLVGAYDEDSAYLVFGGRTGSLNLRLADVWYYGPDFSEAGSDVASAGDLDDDGAMDVAIGAHNSGPSTYTYTGWTFVVLDAGRAPAVELAVEADVTVKGQSTYEYLGSTVLGVGDTNGDGIDDLAIGASGGNAPSINHAGSVFLLHGRGL